MADRVVVAFGHHMLTLRPGEVAIITNHEGAEWIADELMNSAPRDGASKDIYAMVHEELDKLKEEDDEDGE